MNLARWVLSGHYRRRLTFLAGINAPQISQDAQAEEQISRRLRRIRELKSWLSADYADYADYF
ncbi:MAG: hypothetical protein BMS9Abin30_0800 [Gammaproteobacteria bacterium]|nr:MAG: hypothetical protein BMS9Abin30_0800 [Gammaproteobacteria bacterium]